MRLHLQVKRLQEEKKVLLEGFNNIRRYLALEKFNIDTSVNKNDILLRIEETIAEQREVENLIKKECAIWRINWLRIF